MFGQSDCGLALKNNQFHGFRNYLLLLATNPRLLNLDTGTIWIVMWDDSPLSFGRSGQEFFPRIVSLNTFFVVYGREYWKEEVLMEHAEKRIGSIYCGKDGIMDRNKLHEHVFTIENDESPEGAPVRRLKYRQVKVLPR